MCLAASVGLTEDLLTLINFCVDRWPWIRTPGAKFKYIVIFEKNADCVKLLNVNAGRLIKDNPWLVNSSFTKKISRYTRNIYWQKQNRCFMKKILITFFKNYIQHNIIRKKQKYNYCMIKKGDESLVVRRS